MIDFNRAICSCQTTIRRGVVRLAASLWVIMALTACSPDHNWRRVSVADGAVVAMLPAKPHEANRDLTFETHDVRFTLASARVGEVMYTVGVAPLPEALRNDTSARQRFLQETRASLYRNLGNVPPSQAETDQRFVITGVVNEAPIQAHVMAWVTSDTLIEGIVLGDPDNIESAQVEEFFRELAPGQRP